jgi:hypothetical protein
VGDMRKNIKKYIIVVLVFILALSAIVSSDSFTKALNVQYNDVKVVVNGTTLKASTIRYNNQVYIQADALLTSIKKTYAWNEKAKTATISDNLNGVAIKTSSLGDIYSGEVVNGIPNGAGTITFKTGEKYIGQFNNGKFDGAGTLMFKDGEKYVGEFKQDLFHGTGTYYYNSGMKFSGEYINNSPVYGRFYNEAGVLLYEGPLDENGVPITSNNTVVGNSAPPVDIPLLNTPTKSEDVIISKIDGDFDGFENGKIFQLMNGQIWKQVSYEYKYSYKFMPKVTIYKDGTKYKMVVDGVDKTITVERLK